MSSYSTKNTEGRPPDPSYPPNCNSSSIVEVILARILHETVVATRLAAARKLLACTLTFVAIFVGITPLNSAIAV